MQTRISRTALLLALLALTSLEASAQDRWTVKCVYLFPDNLADPRIEDCRDRPPPTDSLSGRVRVAEDLVPAAVAKAQGLDGKARFVDSHLEEATRWLLGLGFDSVLIEREDGGTRYRARILAFEADADHLKVHPEALATFQPPAGTGAPRIYLKAWRGIPTATDLANAADKVAVSNELATPIHELFHAVQAAEVGGQEAYLLLTKEARPTEDCPADSVLDWIVEGTAEAVGLHSLTAVPPAPGVVPPDLQTFYDVPLYDCTIAYNTAHFWLSVGTELGSPGRIRYVQEVFGKGPGPLLADRGVPGVDAALRAASQGERGLSDLYLDVLARHANDTVFYDAVSHVPLDYERELKAVARGTIEPLSAIAFAVSALVPDGEVARLTIGLAEELREDPSLHLIVDDERFDGPTDGGHERNVYSSGLSGAAEPAEFLVRVANVDPDPGGTEPKPFEIDFSIVPGFSAEVSGVANTDVVGAGDLTCIDLGSEGGGYLNIRDRRTPESLVFRLPLNAAPGVYPLSAAMPDYAYGKEYIADISLPLEGWSITTGVVGTLTLEAFDARPGGEVRGSFELTAQGMGTIHVQGSFAFLVPDDARELC